MNNIVDFSLLETNEDRVQFLQQMNQLVENGQCTPELLNTALANYASTSTWLITILETVEIEHNNLKLDYSVWESEKIIETKEKMSFGMSKSLKLSQTEINAQMIVDNKAKYIEWQRQLQLAERKEGFYRRLNDMWKKNADIILCLSNNMRSELRSLSIENKANKEIAEEAIIRRVKIKKEIQQ